MIENQKGAANIIVTMVYILISFVIIAMVTVSATDLLSKSKEQTNYQTMLEYFDKFNLALNDTINNKQITEFSFYNPGEIEIDCTNNKIIGRIDYSGEYRTEETIINDIITYKKNNQIFFEKSFDNQARIQLNCKNSILTNGKKTIQLNQFKYNELTKKIELDVFEKTKIHEDADWYNSNWTFRKKITIDHTKVEEDLYNFPLLVKIRPTSISEYTPNYYIEDDGANKHLWTKINLAPREIKTLIISKEEGFTPNGENVFDFFDDFDGGTLDSKWHVVSGSSTVLSGNSLRINTGAISLVNPLDFSFNQDKIITARSKTINHTSSYGGTTPGISSSQFTAGNNTGADSQIEIMKSPNNTNFYVFAGSGTTTTHNIAAAIISTINLDEYNVFDIVLKNNTFQVLKDKSTIYSSPIVNFTKTMNYIHLGQYNGGNTDIGDTEYDYIYVRKYRETEPKIAITNDGENYLVKITNNSSEEITDYQIKIPGTELGITSKSESINIRKEEMSEEQIQATLDLSYVNSDGSGIVFTLDDGKTKLKREIEYINSVGLLPYYIEETSSKRYVWTKLDLGANEIKTLTVKKTTNNSPDGDEVFEFFDDFDGTSLDSQKWGYSQAFTTTGLINLTAYPGNLALYRSFVVSKNPIDAQNRIYKLRYRSERVASAYDNGFIVMGRDYDKSCADNSGVQFGNNLIYDSEFAIVEAITCSSSTYSKYRSGTENKATFGTYLNYEVIVNSDNTQVKQIVSTDSGMTIDDSNWITPSATYTRSQGYLALNTYNSTSTGGRVRYDYVFVRKYIETEPTIVVSKSGDSFTVTITNNTSQTLTNYQVKIPAEDLEVYSKTRSLEIIDTSFPPNNNALIAWIKIPKLDSTKDTSIYMYYGNPNGNEINDKDTWDSNYLMIQHFSETPNNTTNGFLDSTSYLNHGTPQDFENTAESNTRLEGLIDGAIALGDTENVVVVENNQELNNFNKFTFSAWIKPTGHLNETRSLLVKPLDDWQEPFYLYSFDINQGILGLGISDGITREYVSEGAIAISGQIDSNVWQYVTGVFDGNNLTTYINGNQEVTKQTTITIGENANDLLLGNALQTDTDFIGYLDEFRISKTNKSENWIKTEYLNQSNPYAFYSFELKEYQ